jgi:hypothetical protein
LKIAVRAFGFSTGEVFLATSPDDAVQMWRVGSCVIGLERDEPHELEPGEIVEGISVAEWRKIGQRGLIERRGERA